MPSAFFMLLYLDRLSGVCGERRAVLGPPAQPAMDMLGMNNVQALPGRLGRTTPLAVLIRSAASHGVATRYGVPLWRRIRTSCALLCPTSARRRLRPDRPGWCTSQPAAWVQVSLRSRPPRAQRGVAAVADPFSAPTPPVVPSHCGSSSDPGPHRRCQPRSRSGARPALRMWEALVRAHPSQPQHIPYMTPCRCGLGCQTQRRAGPWGADGTPPGDLVGGSSPDFRNVL